jgi:hypothetical protein
MRTITMLIVAILIFFSLASDVHAEGTELLYGLATDVEAKTVSIIIASSGCTDKSYFSFALDGDVLLFKRIRRDACKAMPMRQAITYSLEELGIRPESNFRIGNPISLTENLF